MRGSSRRTRSGRGDVDPGGGDPPAVELGRGGVAALGGAADEEGEGRPDPQVLVTNDGRVGRSGTKMGGG